jgi:hypothetical protein
MINKFQVIEDCITYLSNSKDKTFSSYSVLRGYDRAIEDLKLYLEQEREDSDYDDVSEYYYDKYADLASDYKYSF